MTQATESTARDPSNLLGIDYRAVPPRRVDVAITDIHTHVRSAATAGPFFEAARAYGVTRVFSMSPLAELPALRSALGGRIDFIAIPEWRRFELTGSFRESWMDDLTRFHQAGVRLCKFWMAPPMRERYGLTLIHDWLAPVIDRALELGFHFMVHVADPSAWWQPGGRYADVSKFGTKPQQYEQLAWFLRRVAPRVVIGAHLGGNIEDPPALQVLLDAYPNLRLDCSATKWVVREVSRHPEVVRAFIVRNADRVLFGSDLVTEDKHDFDHYASRYWAHRMLWETGYRGGSPIEDPDALPTPRLCGTDLPADVLTRLYRDNALALFREIGLEAT